MIYCRQCEAHYQGEPQPYGFIVRHNCQLDKWEVIKTKDQKTPGGNPIRHIMTQEEHDYTMGHLPSQEITDSFWKMIDEGVDEYFKKLDEVDEDNWLQRDTTLENDWDDPNPLCSG